jgi:aminoglycoside phosphotransferase (APT) family kinase protein
VSTDRADRVETYLRGALERPELQVTGLRRVFGGFSRHTYIVEVDEGPALVARLDPEVSLLESNRTVEFGLYRAMADVAGVPVPVAVLDEDDPGPLGRPFFLMHRVPGTASQEQLLPSPHRDDIGRQAIDILGRIATCDWHKLGVGDLLTEPAEPWRAELDKWEQVVDTHQLGPMPVTRAVLRWLRRNPPPPPRRIALVHGDYRTENFLFDGPQVTAVLDWEMAHLGDPLEDLSWWMLDNWRYDRERPGLIGAFFPREEFVAHWERASGLTADEAALRWWTLLSHVKANAIWITAGHRFALGETGDLAMPVIPWVYVNQQEAWMLAELVAAGGAPAPAAAGATT